VFGATPTNDGNNNSNYYYVYIYICNTILSIGIYEYLEYMMAISGLGRLEEIGEEQSITWELASFIANMIMVGWRLGIWFDIYL
jgi:hypothetical protein